MPVHSEGPLFSDSGSVVSQGRLCGGIQRDHYGPAAMPEKWGDHTGQHSRDSMWAHLCDGSSSYEVMSVWHVRLLGCPREKECENSLSHWVISSWWQTRRKEGILGSLGALAGVEDWLTGSRGQQSGPQGTGTPPQARLIGRRLSWL